MLGRGFCRDPEQIERRKWWQLWGLLKVVLAPVSGVNSTHKLQELGWDELAWMWEKVERE